MPAIKRFEWLKAYWWGLEKFVREGRGEKESQNARSNDPRPRKTHACGGKTPPNLLWVAPDDCHGRTSGNTRSRASQCNPVRRWAWDEVDSDARVSKLQDSFLLLMSCLREC
jgi:hypothetical protein